MSGMPSKTDELKDFTLFRYRSSKFKGIEINVMHFILKYIAERVFANESLCLDDPVDIDIKPRALKWDYRYDDKQRVDRLKFSLVVYFDYEDDGD